MRSLPLLSAAVLLALSALGAVHAQDKTLPDIGSSAAQLLSPDQEAEYGAYTLYQLRHYGYVLEDPLIDGWLDAMGHRLAAVSDRPTQNFTFFMMRQRQINAFATLGGYIGVNAGLILAAQSEDEVAGVIAHEVSHVTQRHVLRAVERAQKDQIPIMLATLGAVIAAQKSGSKDAYGNRNNGDAIQAAVVGGQALAMQRQIDYTRNNEAEADRVGIQTLFRSGYDASGMGNFFERMDRLGRGNSGGYTLPSYLQSHPVTTSRLSEARERADRLKKEAPTIADPGSAQDNLLLPLGLALPKSTGIAPPLRLFDWARERLRVLSADSAASALKEANALLEPGKQATDSQRYGQAFAQMRAGYPAAAESGLQALSGKYPDNVWIGLALAENAYTAKNSALSRKRYESILKAHPDDSSVILSYAQTLNLIGNADAGQRAQAILRPILTSNIDNPLFQKNYGRACELAGDFPRAGEAYAEAAYLNGRAEDALNQLAALLKRNDLDYIQRSRIEARIAAITPEVLQMRREGLRPEDQRPDQT